MSKRRVVLDTNVLLRGVLNARSAAGRLVDACDSREFLLLLSRPLLAEYRAVLAHPEIVSRHPELTLERVELVLKRLRYVGDILSCHSRFEFARDPKDEKLIELAIDGRATHIVTADNDLLSLPTGRRDASKRFRQRLRDVQILTPAEFVGS
jgi:uncharacterized protein